MTENLVSVWVGNFPDEEALRTYVALEYDDDGESTSPFARDTGLEWYDDDAMEVFLLNPEQPLEDIAGASFSGSFLPHLKEQASKLSGHNACILLYDLEDDVTMRPGAAVRFVGAFPYTPS